MWALPFPVYLLKAFQASGDLHCAFAHLLKRSDEHWPAGKYCIHCRLLRARAEQNVTNVYSSNVPSARNLAIPAESD
jgi:hypothetical protein